MTEHKGKKIKVLEVIRQGQIGGGESHVLDLIQCLDKTQVCPIAMAFTGGHMINSLREQGIQCYVIETQKAFDKKVQSKIRQVVEEENIDIIHAHGSRAASNMIWTAHKLHIPLIYTVHGWSFHQDQSWFVQKLRAWSEKLICHCATQVICVSESNRLTGVKAFGLNTDKCSVIENGINLKRFNANASYPDLRPELGFTNEDFIAAEICRITLQKAPLDFVKAIEIAHSKDPNIKGLLVGEGDMKDEVYQYIADNKMQDYLKTSPFRTDVPAVLKAIDVYTLPSLWEGLSIALLEAMAMKKPIVVTPTDGTKELINNGINGTVIPFNDPQSLADSILGYKLNKISSIEHGEVAYQIIEQRFNAQRVADSVLQIYKQIKLKKFKK